MPLTGLLGHQEQFSRLYAELVRRPYHAYLFSGPSGVGKRLVAEGLAHALLCERSPGLDFCCTPKSCPVRGHAVGGDKQRNEAARERCACCAGCVQVAARSHPDFALVERPAGRVFVLIEQVRELCALLALKPARAAARISIIDDADSLHPAAQNALLKTLEEPPGHALLFLIAESERLLLDTVRSRLRPVHFGPLSVSDLVSILQHSGAATAQPAELARMARGSAARVLELANHQAPPARELLDALGRAGKMTAADAYRLAEDRFANRDQALANFELLARMLEDMLCLKLLGTPPQAADANTGRTLNELATAFSLEAILISLEQALAAAGAIDGMANPRIQAERWWATVTRAVKAG